MSSPTLPASVSSRACERLRGRRRRWRVVDGLAEGGDGLGDVVRRGAAAHPLLEQADLAREVGVLALEVGERLFGRRVGVLADGPLAVRLAHVDGAVVVDAAPGA